MIVYYFELSGMAPNDWLVQFDLVDEDSGVGIWQQLMAQEIGWA